MWLYLIIFAIPFFLYVSGHPQNKNNIFLFWYTLFLALFVGLSDMFGGFDRYVYGQIFDKLADAITDGKDFKSISAGFFFEPGFSILSYWIGWITENRYIYIFILTLIIYSCIYIAFKRHISNYPFAFMIFLGMMFFFTFTYLRQILAVGIAWISIKYLLNRDWKRFILLIFLIALMHKSGIVFALLFFIPQKKWNPIWIVIIFFICFLIGLSGITSNLYDNFVEIANVASVNNYSEVQSARVAYILEVIFFAWAILSNYHKITPTKENVIFLNMAWGFCAMLLLFLRSENGGRLSWYFSFGIICTLTNIISQTQIKQWRKSVSHFGKIISIVMLILYLRIYVSWEKYDMLYPYKTFLTDGRREKDYIADIYEYDQLYVKDKFYRTPFRLLK